MMPVNSGQLDQRIILQTRASGVDALGQESTTWSDTMTIWAAAEPLRGREFFAAGQTQSQVDVRFRVRWRETITPTMRVSWRGDLFDIVSVIEPKGGREQLELMCATASRDTR
jgi:SPP1 family predicted phage head-tail adaptor